MSGDNRTTKSSVGEAHRRLPPVRRLELVYGGARAATVVVAREPIVIGRDASGGASLVLRDDEVSRRHASVQQGEDGASWIEDHGSRNGTFVDGRRIAARTRLGDGAVIRVGACVLLHVERPANVPAARSGESRLIGPSAALARVRSEIDMVAPQLIPVLILGPTGVGKELVASELHERSGRSGPFLAVNCASLPPALAESELFGHAAGAFTGALTRGATGLFHAAAGGTLFLDEVGELPETVQPKLLRALATGEVRAVGASENTRVDVRVIAATHRDLDDGKFREDLHARLKGWVIEVPALRARREDVLPLAGAFLRRDCRAQPSADAAEALLLHGWPANVRELEQVMRAAAVRVGGAWHVQLEHLPPELGARLEGRERDGAGEEPSAAGTPPPDDEAIAPSREELTQLLRTARGSVAVVARELGKDRRQIYRWLRRYGLAADDFRDG